MPRASRSAGRRQASEAIARTLKAIGPSTSNPINAGSAPIASENDAIPKAIPLDAGMRFASEISVTGMVKLKRNAVSMPMAGNAAAKGKRAAEPARDAIEAAASPRRSASTPPAAFPATMPATSPAANAMSAFQGNAISMPA